jgi:hypothetical protein
LLTLSLLRGGEGLADKCIVIVISQYITDAGFRACICYFM